MRGVELKAPLYSIARTGRSSQILLRYKSEFVCLQRCSAGYETRTSGAMRGVELKAPLYSIIIEKLT